MKNDYIDLENKIRSKERFTLIVGIILLILFTAALAVILKRTIKWENEHDPQFNNRHGTAENRFSAETGWISLFR